MSQHDLQYESLLRYLDGNSTEAERRQIAQQLCTDPDARERLREVAEQAVLMADLERNAAARQDATRHAHPVRSASRPRQAGRFRRPVWKWGVAAALSALALVVAFMVVPVSRPAAIQVSKATGASQYFGSTGTIENELQPGMSLGAGDTLETRSCDAWIAIGLEDGSSITIAGRSSLSILNEESGERGFKLRHGNLWVSPARQEGDQFLVIHTPIATVEARGAQFDIQTSSAEMILRVNAGTAHLTRTTDSLTVAVRADHQVVVSLHDTATLAVTPQPTPIDYWACDLWQVPEVILGDWLPPTPDERARLGAEPLLWPISQRDSVMLYAVALAAWRSTEHPVLLQPRSRLLVRGRTNQAQTVRFGFSTQKMRGVFAGKFELDVPPSVLGSPGETWETELPLSDFRPLHPQLAASVDGLELTDVYVLTIEEDAGLEINHIELIPE